MREVALAASVVIKPVVVQAASTSQDAVPDLSTKTQQEAANADSVTVPKEAPKTEATEIAKAA